MLEVCASENGEEAFSAFACGQSPWSRALGRGEIPNNPINTNKKISFVY